MNHTRAIQKSDRESALVIRPSFHSEGDWSSFVSEMMSAVDCSWSFSPAEVIGLIWFSASFSRIEDSADDPSAMTTMKKKCDPVELLGGRVVQGMKSIPIKSLRRSISSTRRTSCYGVRVSHLRYQNSVVWSLDRFKRWSWSTKRVNVHEWIEKETGRGKWNTL